MLPQNWPFVFGSFCFFFFLFFFFWKCWVLGMIYALSGNCSSFYNREKPQHVLQKLILIHTILCKFTDYSGRVTHLKIFGVVIPKERLLGRTPAIFVWYDTDYRFVICSLHRLHCIVNVIQEEGFAGPHPPKNHGKTGEKKCPGKIVFGQVFST